MRRRKIAISVASSLLAVGIFLAGMYAARATPGGETRKFLTFSGRLTGRTGPQMLTFTFRKGTTTACAPVVMATPDVSGNFSVEIPLASCAAHVFDGSDVTVEISVGGTVLSAARPINPVPYALYADRVGVPDCPLGYEHVTDATLPPRAFLCRKGADEMMRVGSGVQTFWMDRYLNSLWSSPDGTGTQILVGTSSTIAANGTYTVPTYTLSKVGVPTSHSFTYFQAQTLCRIVGKRLPTLAEMLLAVEGTPRFMQPWAGSTGVRPDECPGARMLDYNTGSTPQCISAWGVEQLLGYRTQILGQLQFAPAGTSNFNNVMAQTFSAYNPYQGPIFTLETATYNITGPVNFGSLGLRCVISP